MSGAGFRTLVVASKVVPAAEYEAWAAEFKAASAALSDRESKVRGTGPGGGTWVRGRRDKSHAPCLQPGGAPQPFFKRTGTPASLQVAACCERMERGLTLLGATAVEDKLQVGGRGGRGVRAGAGRGIRKGLTERATGVWERVSGRNAAPPSLVSTPAPSRPGPLAPDHRTACLRPSRASRPLA
jgi:hypothetical protein